MTNSITTVLATALATRSCTSDRADEFGCRVDCNVARDECEFLVGHFPRRPALTPSLWVKMVGKAENMCTIPNIITLFCDQHQTLKNSLCLH